MEPTFHKGKVGANIAAMWTLELWTPESTYDATPTITTPTTVCHKKNCAVWQFFKNLFLFLDFFCFFMKF
jgi:hypothetical protein